MSDHPLIAAAVKDSEKNGEQLHADFAEKFLLTHPDSRAALLDQIDAAVQAEDGTSLRQKAQLMGLRRTLRATHDAMRRANR